MFKVTFDDFFVGIDDSNHGAFPEIRVALVYQAPQCIDSAAGYVWRNTYYEKLRGRGKGFKSKLDSLLNSNPVYKFLLVNEDDSRSFDGMLEVNVIISLLTGLGLNIENIIKVFIDGRGTNRTKKQVASILKRDYGIKDFSGRQIEFRIGGDKKIKIVNDADILAYHLYTNRDDLSDFVGHRVDLKSHYIFEPKQGYVYNSGLRM